MTWGEWKKEVMKGWSQLEAVCVGRGFGFKSCSSTACEVSCLALELSSVRWVPRGVASLELIQKQGVEQQHLASSSEGLLPFVLFCDNYNPGSLFGCGLKADI